MKEEETMKKYTILLAVLLLLTALFTACGEEPAPAPVTVCQHVYEDACVGTKCLLCGFERQAPGHQLEDVYLEDDANQYLPVSCDHPAMYYQVCAVCGAWDGSFNGDFVRPHYYVGACATECRNCGTTRYNPIPHEYDENYVCKVCGHQLTQDECTHVYTFPCASECRICGAHRDASHLYLFDCDTDCRYCAQTLRPDARHADANGDGVCDLCLMNIGTTRPGDVPGTPGADDWFD